MVSERRFGVEIECTYGQKPTKQSDVYGGEAGSRAKQKKRARADFQAHPDFKRWADSITIDGSGIEIRSPILKGQEGIEELAAFFDFLIEKGSSVTNQDGMHVHHEAKDLKENLPALFNATKSWAEYTPVINTMVAPRRRRSNMCRHNWSKEALAKLEKVCTSDKTMAELQKEYREQVQRYYASRRALRYPNFAYCIGNIVDRGAFNINNLDGGKGTIEIRLAEGVMDTAAAVAWVKFGQAFIDSHVTRKQPIGCRATLDDLFKAINLDADARAILRAKAANNGHALVNAAPGKLANGVLFDESEDDE